MIFEHHEGPWGREMGLDGFDALTMLILIVPLRKRPAAFGLIGGMWGIASVAGPLLGGVFTFVKSSK
jgi:MFS family permease